MKWNVKALIALGAGMLLAGCGGGHDAPYSAGDYPPAGYAAGQSGYGAPAPGDGYGAPGAAYAPPPSATGAPPPAGGYDGQAGYPPPANGAPSATSGQGDANYDEVGYATTLSGGTPGQLAVSVRGLATGSFVEVTVLATGRTVLLENNIMVPLASGRLVGFSPAAAAALGLSGGSDAVRVRQVNPSAQDQAAVRRNTAPVRMDAPEPLLAGLRRKLGGAPVVPPPAPVPAPGASAPPPASGGATQGGFYVQVAALSNRARADALAAEVKGFVQASGSLYRVQVGPFANQAAAERARADVAARGFGDARVFEKR